MKELLQAVTITSTRGQGQGKLLYAAMMDNAKQLMVTSGDTQGAVDSDVAGDAGHQATV